MLTIQDQHNSMAQRTVGQHDARRNQQPDGVIPNPTGPGTANSLALNSVPGNEPPPRLRGPRQYQQQQRALRRQKGDSLWKISKVKASALAKLSAQTT